MKQSDNQKSTAARQQNPFYETAMIQRITWIGMFVNIGLAGLKFIVGYLGASQAVIADAVHSLSDMATDIAVIIGVKLWSAPPDKCHPYGHRRVEALVTIFIGVMLAAVACGLAYKAVATLNVLHKHHTTLIAIWGPLLSIFLKEILYQWTALVGRRVKSAALLANAWHHRSDALSSVPAVIAVAGASFYPSLDILDHIGALIIAGFILHVSWKILSPALAEVSDHGASEAEQDRIYRIAMTVEGVTDVHAVRTRKSGARCLVDLHIHVAPNLSVRAGHDIAEAVKRQLIEDGPDILDVLVHVEPDEKRP